MKKFTVYIPVIHSEVYHVEANTPEEAIKVVKDQCGHCIGEVCTGREDAGDRAVEGWK